MKLKLILITVVMAFLTACGDKNGDGKVFEGDWFGKRGKNHITSISIIVKDPSHIIVKSGDYLRNAKMQDGDLIVEVMGGGSSRYVYQEPGVITGEGYTFKPK